MKGATMHPSVSRPRRPLILVLPLALAVVAIGFSGGFSALARAGDASLEFVGNLMSVPWEFSLDPLDPTFPHNF